MHACTWLHVCSSICLSVPPHTTNSNSMKEEKESSWTSPCNPIATSLVLAVGKRIEWPEGMMGFFNMADSSPATQQWNRRIWHSSNSGSMPTFHLSYLLFISLAVVYLTVIWQPSATDDIVSAITFQINCYTYTQTKQRSSINKLPVYSILTKCHCIARIVNWVLCFLSVFF